MDKRVILAVAGAGKTYHICNSLQKDKKNLILAYTHENIYNIKKELIKKYGIVPELTNVMTFDSFVYRFLLCPYEPSILRFFNCINFKSKGITTLEPPSQRIKNSRGDDIPNPYYFKKDNIRHYVNKRGQYYCASISELIMIIKENRKSLIKKASIGLNLFYEQIMIDEFQDFRNHDYELIMALVKELNNVLLVGDYHQHSVSAVNNSGKPFKNGKNEISYDDFKQLLLKSKLVIDETSLKSSRRCPTEICEYVEAKLGIVMSSNNSHVGQVIWIDNDIEKILDDNSIVKLVFKESNKYSFKAVNWSYSKGDTMDSVCVILTKKFAELDCNNFQHDSIPKSTINKLYVAMTRTKGNLYFIKEEHFKKVKQKYYNVIN